MRGPAKEQQINLKFDKPSAYKPFIYLIALSLGVSRETSLIRKIKKIVDKLK